MGNSAPAVDAQQVFKSSFKALINEGYSIAIDIERYQGMLGLALSKVDFSVGMGIYMLPGDLNLIVGKTKGCNSKLLLSNTDMKIGPNRDINKDHKKLPPQGPDKVVVHCLPKEMKHTDKAVKDCLATQDENLKMFAEKHNDDKLVITLLIVGAGLIAFHFW